MTTAADDEPVAGVDLESATDEELFAEIEHGTGG
jgi:hypothetical protein